MNVGKGVMNEVPIDSPLYEREKQKEKENCL